jgi:hypothetical protein
MNANFFGNPKNNISLYELKDTKIETITNAISESVKFKLISSEKLSSIIGAVEGIGLDNENNKFSIELYRYKDKKDVKISSLMKDVCIETIAKGYFLICIHEGVEYKDKIQLNFQTINKDKDKKNIENIKDGKQVNILNDQDFKSKIESKYKTTGKEDWLNIISPYLIFIGEIETNRNQTMSERMGAAYQCHLSTKLIRLPDGKELIYSDIFSVKEKVVVDSISKYLKDNKIKFEESDLELTGESLVQFYALNNYEFSLIDTKSIADSCNPLFDKKIPINIISPFLTKWIKQQLQIFT